MNFHLPFLGEHTVHLPTWALYNTRIKFKIKIMKHGLLVKHKPSTFLHLVQHFLKHCHL